VLYDTGGANTSCVLCDTEGANTSCVLCDTEGANTSRVLSDTGGANTSWCNAMQGRPHPGGRPHAQHVAAAVQAGGGRLGAACVGGWAASVDVCAHPCMRACADECLCICTPVCVSVHAGGLGILRTERVCSWPAAFCLECGLALPFS